ncbi:MAG: hypothetical protein V1809_10325 [Planctomycetota bacterium]
MPTATLLSCVLAAPALILLVAWIALRHLWREVCIHILPHPEMDPGMPAATPVRRAPANRPTIRHSRRMTRHGFRTPAAELPWKLN